MWIKYTLVALIGLSAGGVIAAGLFSFVTMVGVMTRLATRTKTANQINLYEDCFVLGAGLGNWVSILPFSLSFDLPLLIAYGLFSGIFVGCLAIALAEVLNVIPVFVRRIKLRKGLVLIMCTMAAAKCLATLLQLVWMGKN